jgi:hypothetical protein
LVQSILSRIATATLVRVTAVTNAGGISPVGFVDILPLVNQTDGAGNAVPHKAISHCPYFRLQGGTNAVIIDPQVGDIGIAVFASRDISSVMANKGQANPGSWRRFDMADGLYVGGVLNGAPSQYVAFTASGISIVTPGNLTFQAANATLDASGNLTVKGDVTAGSGGADSVTLQGHKHGTGSAAAGTVAPTAGT